MEYIHVKMIRNNLDNLLDYPIPDGYFIRNLKKGDEYRWAEIETAAGEFKDIEFALNRFEKEFGQYLDEMEKRCYFIDTDKGRSIGTATAWYNKDFRDGKYGRLHWVGIHKDFQGKKLGKPLVSAVMKNMAQFHNKTYLTTQTISIVAIKIYLDFGYEPLLTSNNCQRAWHLIAKELNHAELRKYL